jgi:lipopolysaccharide export system permease protein
MIFAVWHSPDEDCVKIIDRYILASIASAFLFGVAMFMALLMAMQLLPDLIRLVAEQGVSLGTAIAILAYQLPGLLVYAFPMSILLCILLVFNRMSAESEMVAIRAGGISFLRIVIPALLFAMLVTALTFWINNDFMPIAQQRSLELRQQALQEARELKSVDYSHIDKDGHKIYSISAANVDVKNHLLERAVFIFYNAKGPMLYVYTPLATWNQDEGTWRAKGAVLRWLAPNAAIPNMDPVNADADLAADSYLLQVKESASELDPAAQKVENLTAAQINQQIQRFDVTSGNMLRWHKLHMELLRRYAVPFACLVFALIGAPLGLRHHRTSSAVGLGVSLLLIIVYYFVAHFCSMLGDRGAMPYWAAAWMPNILGAIAGVGLMVKANQ